MSSEYHVISLVESKSFLYGHIDIENIAALYMLLELKFYFVLQWEIYILYNYYLYNYIIYIIYYSYILLRLDEGDTLRVCGARISFARHVCLRRDF